MIISVKKQHFLLYQVLVAGDVFWFYFFSLGYFECVGFFFLSEVQS